MGSWREGGSAAAIFVYPDAMTLTTLPGFKRNLLVGTVLGHVIAHEVGHVLLREGHTEQGLMRAEWLKRDLELAKSGRLGFTPEQGARIRAQPED